MAKKPLSTDRCAWGHHWMREREREREMTAVDETTVVATTTFIDFKENLSSLAAIPVVVASWPSPFALPFSTSSL